MNRKVIIRQVSSGFFVMDVKLNARFANEVFRKEIKAQEFCKQNKLKIAADIFPEYCCVCGCGMHAGFVIETIVTADHYCSVECRRTKVSDRKYNAWHNADEDSDTPAAYWTSWE